MEGDAIKTYEEHSWLRTCTVRRADLRALCRVVREGLPANAGFEIIAKLRNDEVTLGSIDELFQMEDLPDTPKELTIRSWFPNSYRSVSDIEQHISVCFSPLYSSVSVDGREETWVLGKHRQVVRFFESRYGKLRAFRRLFSGTFVVSIVIGACIVFVVRAIIDWGILYPTIMSIALTYLLSRYIDGSKSLEKGPRVILGERTPRFLGMEIKELIPIVLSVLGIIVSIVVPVLQP